MRSEKKIACCCWFPFGLSPYNLPKLANFKPGACTIYHQVYDLNRKLSQIVDTIYN